MSAYDYSVNSNINSVKKHIYHITKTVVYGSDFLTDVDDEIDTQDDDSILENMNYGLDYANSASPNAQNNAKGEIETKYVSYSDLSLLSAKNKHLDDLIFTNSDEDNEPDEAIDDDDHVPSEITDYFTESTITAKMRNKMDDEEFGLPRLRKYPLNDRTHVAQAIRMFRHVKDPKDQKVLADNIIRKYNEFGMTTKIGKNNPLSKYVPKKMLNEHGDLDMPVVISGYEKPEHKRTREDIIKEHLRANSLFYNYIFYNDDFVKYMKSVDSLQFLNYFYPSFKIHSFSTRLHSAIGGMAYEDDAYECIGLKNPLKSHDIPDIPDSSKIDDLEFLVTGMYTRDYNYYREDVSDIVHIKYCLELYCITSYILNNRDFNEAEIPEFYKGVLMDWPSQIEYHYAAMQEEKPYSKMYFRHCQYLHDLLWDPLDNPELDIDVSANIICLVKNMACSYIQNMNESTELIDKTDTKAYLVKELNMEDDLYLIPSSLEYPIIDKSSVKLAMDMIGKIDKENIPEYTANLNRKYHEFGCTFSIPVDHPYAKYASDEIVDHMSCLLCEDSNSVADSGVDVSSSEGPWYKTINWGYYNRNLLDNDELGPNDIEGKEAQDVYSDSIV